MRVLIIATNRNKSPYPVAPLGILYVAAASEKAGYEVDVLDMSFVRSPARALSKTLKRKNYVAVGIGIRNLDSCSWAFQESYFEGVKEIFNETRRLTNAPLILGGSGFSISPIGWIKRLKPDYGVIGEGEKAFVLLLDCIANGKPATGIDGVITSENCCNFKFFADKPKVNELVQAAHHLCNYAKYLSLGGYVGIQSKRGCPFHCIYCNYPNLEGRKLRLRDPDLVAYEIENVFGNNKRCYVFITDNVFNGSRKHALKICRKLIKRNSSVPWMAYCNPFEFDDELAKAMKAAGCIGIEMSLDAASEKMIKVLNKPFGQEDIRRCLQAVSDAGLPTVVQLLFGGPGENAGDIDEAQHFLDSCKTPNAVFASIGLRIYPGTELERIARRENMLSQDADLFLPRYYVSPSLGKDPLNIVDSIARRRWEWSTPADWSRLSMRIVQAILNRTGTRPQWRDAKNYGRYIRR
jgi:radical SAM superfamily enzyme YgiQ (UPF0313 family)